MASGSGLGGLWTLIKILLVIFAVTACYTSDLVKNDPDQAIVAAIIWVIVIVGIIVAFMAISYAADRNPGGSSYAPAYAQTPFGQGAYNQPAPVYQQYPMYAQPTPVNRTCRYCDAMMAPYSPICPSCGRKN